MRDSVIDAFKLFGDNIVVRSDMSGRYNMVGEVAVDEFTDAINFFVLASRGQQKHKEKNVSC
jgi:hypothetical protein